VAHAVDPAFTANAGDLDRKPLNSKHITEQPPSYEDQATHEHGYLDGEALPTEEELHTLQRVPAPIPLMAYTIAFMEFVERMCKCNNPS
jgi:proton-dependent oligopeptide transporter, POT family